MDTKHFVDTTPNNNRIKLNIGGKLFETTTSTLQSAGPTSLLTTTHHPIFIDHDPDIFSPLLSLLRTHRLPSTALRHFSLHHLLTESHFYNLPISSFLSPPPFSPFDASFTTSLISPSSSLVSAFSASSPTFPLLLAHSGQVSFYDPITLSLSSTLRTHLDDISAVASISPDIAAVGSYSSPGVHFYSRENHVSSLYWVDESDTRVAKSRVTAVADSGTGDSVKSVFSAAFECKHGENVVLVIDKSTLKVVAEIGRQSGNSAKSSAIKRLKWVPREGLLVGSSVKCGAFGYSGYVRVWDTRSGEIVWETSEPGGVIRSSRLGDSMVDVDVDTEGLFLAKVGSRTGDLGVADLRKLGPDPWVYLKDPNPGLSGNWEAGMSVVVHCYEGNVFVGRDGGLEAWSRLGKREVVGDGGDRKWDVYRRNFVDKVEDAERGIIGKIEGCGNRLFVSRENVEGVEVWETSHFSGVKPVL